MFRLPLWNGGEYPLSLILRANGLVANMWLLCLFRLNVHVIVADMSSSATLKSILLQAGGFVTLHSQNNSLIPQDVIELTMAVLHKIAQLLASSPNIPFKWQVVEGS